MIYMNYLVVYTHTHILKKQDSPLSAANEMFFGIQLARHIIVLQRYENFRLTIIHL